MPRIAYVNGRYVPHVDAKVHIEDRGFQLSDGIYEVIAIRGGYPIDLAPHLVRLDRSLRELRIAMPVATNVLKMILGEVVRRNGIDEGIVYLQITRGVARRDHAFPVKSSRSLVITARRHKLPTEATFEKGVAVVTAPDLRWRRCDIKSVGLLANALGKQTAKEAGAYEAWLVNPDGFVTEGSSSNAWIVTANGDVGTHPGNNDILSGVTRKAVIDVATKLRYKVVERPFTVAEALTAAEAFLTSTTSFLMPVLRIDGKTISSGKPGPISRRLWRAYVDSLATRIKPW
ncbi:MAG: D-amino-acid transaminase [Alphaproteobacteria bacterium]|nr:D-amino-acid transaminase [Alphaproteobacteria bacterium]